METALRAGKSVVTANKALIAKHGTRLAELAEKGEARIAEEGEFGRKYSVSGLLTGPRGRAVSVVSVWIFEHGSDKPRLVTVYPKEP